MESFLTIRKKSEGLYKEKGSKFISLAFPVSDENETKHHLQETRKKYYDARHYCYAYIIGSDQANFRANDDGEPHHSAGDPILGQIRSKNLTNVLVIVVRYFGGTKLGVGGLINAYKTASNEALENSQIIKIVITIPVKLEFDYDQTSAVMKLINDFEVRIESQNFTDKCTITGAIKPTLVNSFEKEASLIKELLFDFP